MRLQRWAALLIVISLLVGVGSSQSTRRTIRRSLKRVWLIATGDLVDVGGYRLEISCQGQGEITVVLDNGLCQEMSSWGSVPSGVAKFTRICTYNRTGRGYSSPAPSPRSGQQLVYELHTLLELKGAPRRSGRSAPSKAVNVFEPLGV